MPQPPYESQPIIASRKPTCRKAGGTAYSHSRAGSPDGIENTCGERLTEISATAGHVAIGFPGRDLVSDMSEISQEEDPLSSSFSPGLHTPA